MFESLTSYVENRFQTPIHYDTLRLAAGPSCSRASSREHVTFLSGEDEKKKGMGVNKPSTDKLCQHNPKLQGKAGAPTLGKSSLLLWLTGGGRRAFSKQLSWLPCYHSSPNMHQKARQNCSNVIYLVTKVDFCPLNCLCIHNQVLVCF